MLDYFVKETSRWSLRVKSFRDHLELDKPYLSLGVANNTHDAAYHEVSQHEVT